MYDDACVYENAHVIEDAYVCDKSIIHGQSILADNAMVTDNVHICGKSLIYGNISDNACIVSSWIFQDTDICGDAFVSNSFVRTYANLGTSAFITSNKDYFVIQHVGPDNVDITFYLDIDRRIWAFCSDYEDIPALIIDDFEENIKEKYHDTIYEHKLLSLTQYAKCHFE